MRRQYTSVKGVTDNLRFPRLGKIHLGVKVNNGMKEYPKETDYFVCPEEVRKVFGDTPKTLPIMFPVDNDGVVFPQAYKLYQGPNLRCKGDGESALRVAGYLGAQKDTAKEPIPGDPNALVEITCPCPLLSKDLNGRAKCNLVGSLSFMIPDVSIAGVYQIDMRGWNSIQNLNSSLALTRRLAGTIAMVPFMLHRVPQQIAYKDKTSTHYILRLDHQLTLKQVKHFNQDRPALELSQGFINDEAELPPLEEPPPDAVEDAPKGDPTLKRMSIFVSEILYPEITGRDETIIRGRDKPEEESPYLDFITRTTAQVGVAFESAKERCCVDIKYSVDGKGDFIIHELEKGIPF